MSEMNEEVYNIAFQLIMSAGDARSSAQEAIQLAAEYKFDEAQAKLKDANAAMNQAHQVQTDLIQAEAAGKKYEINIILVHAQDHFAMATTAIDDARQKIALYKKIYELERR